MALPTLTAASSLASAPAPDFEVLVALLVAGDALSAVVVEQTLARCGKTLGDLRAAIRLAKEDLQA